MKTMHGMTTDNSYRSNKMSCSDLSENDDLMMIECVDNNQDNPTPLCCI